MMYVVEMGSCGMMYLQSFMNIGTGVQTILRFVLSYLIGCKVCITHGRDL
jgi:hypothetical protein